MDKCVYMVKRLLQMIIVFFIVTILIFAMIRLLPGDTATAMLGERATQEKIDALNEKLGLNQPIYIQYFLYMKNLLRLDFGNSLLYKKSVVEVISPRIQVTVMLTLVSTLFTVLLSIPFGFIAGMRQNKPEDMLIRLFTLFGLAVPSFWIGLMLLLEFGVTLKWFPVSGWGTTWAEHIKSLILPSVTQAIASSAIVIRNLRNNIVDVKKIDYVDFAYSKGISDQRVSVFHILRNALVPTATLLSLRIAGMLGGSVVIESVFSLPGIGQLLVDAIYSRDYPLVQAVVLFFSVIVLVINLLTDLLYMLLDPRVELE